MVGVFEQVCNQQSGGEEAQSKSYQRMSRSYKNPSEVEVNHLVLPSHADAQDVNCLNAGQLLKWMDTVACLSAEKHAKAACVTALVDDLCFEKQKIYVGQVVNLQARVNRAFNTSMEVGVCVRAEDLLSGEIESVCEVLFTFVALDENGQKVRLDPVDPFTKEEKLQYSLAAERRRQRLNQHSLKDDISSNPAQLSSSGPVCSETKASETAVENVELVLPQHANHHKTTFGGQIMAWMHSACTISANRLCRSAHPHLTAVDEVKFRGPSKVGDRVIIKAIVNNTMQSRIEVGCRVEAYSIGGEVRHINSAFFMFIAPENKGVKLSRVLPVTEEEKRRAAETLIRERLRYERREILKSVGPVIAVSWSPRIGQLLNLNNIRALMKLYHITNWQQVNVTDGIPLYKGELDDLVCLKATFKICLPARRVYTLLSDDQRVREWDPLVSSCHVVQENKEDAILHMILENMSGDGTSKLDDVVVLASRREPCEHQEHYTIAYRSVKHDKCPPSEKYNRAEHLCSGWLIDSDVDRNGSSLTYFNQITRDFADYVRSDLLKGSSFYATRAKALIKFLSNSKS